MWLLEWRADGHALGGPTQVTTHSSEDRDPALSRDGQRLAFRSDRSGNPDIYVQNLATSELTQVTAHASEDGEPSFSADGSTVYFQSQRSGNFDIWAQAADGSTSAEQLTTATAGDLLPRVAPGGSQIVYTFGEGGGNFNVFTMRPDGSEKTRVTTNTADDRQGVMDPTGNRIAFRSNRDNKIWTIRTDGTDEQQLTSGPGSDSFPTYSPDGRFIAFDSTRAGGSNIWIISTDGSGKLYQVTTGGQADTAPTFGFSWR